MFLQALLIPNTGNVLVRPSWHFKEHSQSLTSLTPGARHAAEGLPHLEQGWAPGGAESSTPSGELVLGRGDGNGTSEMLTASAVWSAPHHSSMITYGLFGAGHRGHKERQEQRCSPGLKRRQRYKGKRSHRKGLVSSALSQYTERLLCLWTQNHKIVSLEKAS